MVSTGGLGGSDPEENRKLTDEEGPDLLLYPVETTVGVDHRRRSTVYTCQWGGRVAIRDSDAQVSAEDVHSG